MIASTIRISSANPREGRTLQYLGILILAWVLALGASASADAATRPLRFDRLSIEQGLSQSTVLAIHQDREGFLWLATEDGLNRYDGYDFTVYKHDPADPASLPFDYIWALAEDGDGDLWIGTDGGGVARWDRETGRFVSYRHDPAAPASLASDHIRTLAADPAGGIWVGHRERGLDHLDPATGTVTHYRHDPAAAASLADDRVFALHLDRSGALWAGTEGGLQRLTAKGGGFESFGAGLDDPRVRSLAEDGGGALWVGTFSGGVYRVARESGTVTAVSGGDATDPAASDQVRAILEDDAGRLWIATGRGLALVDHERGELARYRHDPFDPYSLATDDVMSVHQDRSGLVWVGTQAGGLHRWNPATWAFGHHPSDPKDPESLSHGSVLAFTEDARGRLWVGSYGGGLNVFARGSGEGMYRRVELAASGLTDDRVMALAAGRRGEIWVGTFKGGLHRLDGGKNRFEEFRHDPARPDSLSSDRIMSLLEDRRGRLWVGTFGGGLNRHDGSGKFTRFLSDPADPASLSGSRITCLAEAPDGALWVGTDGGGLDRYDEATGTFEVFRHVAGDPTSLPADTVYSLHVAADGTLWAGTRDGLGRLEQSETGEVTFRRYGEGHGLPNDAIYGIQPDAAGHLWLSTNRGLARFDPAAETAIAYSASHGLQAAEFHFGAHYRSAAGELFFGGLNGFNAFFPERLPTGGKAPPVVLTALSKLNQPVADAGPVEGIDSLALGYRDDVVTFEFAALDFAAPEENRYAYMLEGFDRDWVDLGSVRRVTYTNLDPGNYVFRVKAAGHQGVWNEAGLAIPVWVEAPPWRRWWAYLSYLMLFASGSVGYVWVQQQNLRREEEYSHRLEDEVDSRTRQLEERAGELERLNAQLVEASLTDSLTGLANRRFLLEYLDKEIALVRRSYAAYERGSLTADTFDLVFMMVDLDDFKSINDTCGHAAGDLVLTQVRDVLSEACRGSDLLIRWGGDEFLVVGRDSDPDGLQSLAERVRANIEGHAFTLDDGQVVRTTCSIGFACYPFLRTQLDALSWEQVVSVADRALYVAKESGRNAWVGFVGNDQTPTSGLLSLLREEPDQLSQDGRLTVETSLPESRELVWR